MSSTSSDCRSKEQKDTPVPVLTGIEKSVLPATETTNPKSQRPELSKTDEEQQKRERREARMKKRREKKKRKRDKLLLASAIEAKAKKVRSDCKRDQPSDAGKESAQLGKADFKERKEAKSLNISFKKSLKLSSSVPLQKKQLPAVIKSNETVRDHTANQVTKTSKSSEISFPINEECTSLVLCPSGRHVVAGFTDGTLRLFDTTGRLWRPLSSTKYDATDPIKSEINNLFDSDSDEEEIDFSLQTSHRCKQRMVASKSFQNFGAVACQIHAKGVITSLLMDVDCCEDGHFAFGGVLRGSTELVAVDLTLVEHYHDQYNTNDGNGQESQQDILDLIKVYRHSDAKLKGFGACIRLKNTKNPEYRLFTGKGIKNMHIWSFVPPVGGSKEPSWQCLYDTPTNGNTITYLKFRRDSNGLLQGISKSDDQKLRIWDLSFEESRGNQPKAHSIIKQLARKAEKEQCLNRPKRPPYIDILSTENALGVCGSYVFSGGDSMYNQMGVMFLDAEDIQSQFNHTELALPNVNCSDNSTALPTVGRRSARSGRQQRGELKSVVKVAGLDKDAHHVLLELSDRSLVHYCQKENRSSLVPLAIMAPCHVERIICVTRVELSGSTVLSLSSYDTNKSRGSITLAILPENAEGGTLGSPARYGFTEPGTKQRKHLRNKLKLKLSDLHANENGKSLPVFIKCRKKQGKSSSKTVFAAKTNLFAQYPDQSRAADGKEGDIKLKITTGLTSTGKCSPPLVTTTPVKIASSLSSPALKPGLRAPHINANSEIASPPKVLDHVTLMPLGRQSKGKGRLNHNVDTGKNTVDENLMVTPDPKKKNKRNIFPAKKEARVCNTGVIEHIDLSTEKFSPVPVENSGEKNITPVSNVRNTEQVQPVGVAVSPEQQRNINQPTKLRAAENSKSISKFFTKTKHYENESKKKCGKRKIKFKKKIGAMIKNKPLDRTDTVSIDEENVPKERPLEEIDIASALCALRKRASEEDLVPSHLPVQSIAPSAANQNQQVFHEQLLTCRNPNGSKFTKDTSPLSIPVRIGARTPICRERGSPSASRTARIGVCSKSELDLDKTHCFERRQLAMHHRVSHERLKNAMLSSSERIMNAAYYTDHSKNSSKAQLTDFLRHKIMDNMENHQVALNDLMENQRMEASSLARNQMLQSGLQVPELAVSFPFPEIFDQVRDEMMTFLSSLS